ncbi:MAG: hypothetical protein IT580_20375 [Verrucomicrobiales bacterium]|nr:hypothetical protein [Verrucomicrobiales bacterium]
MFGLGFDQRWATGTYAGFELTERSAQGERSLGVLRNATLAPIPDTPGQLRYQGDYRERTASVYARQLLGDRFSAGAAFTVSQTTLDSDFPSLSRQVPGVASLTPSPEALLSTLTLSARYQHPGGFHAAWTSEWWSQENNGDAEALGAERFWQHQIGVGYTFPGRRADLEVRLLNLTDEDYRLNPLSYYLEPPRQRTLELRLRLAF